MTAVLQLQDFSHSGDLFWHPYLSSWRGGVRGILVAQFLGAVLGVLTGLLLFMFVKRLAQNGGIAYLTLASFLFSPQIIKHNINGMETSLAILGVIVLFLFFLGLVSHMTDPKTMFVFGLVSGIVILARLDSALLMLSMLGFLLAEYVRKNLVMDSKAKSSLIFSLVLFATGLGLAILPWGMFCTSLGYNWLPESGGAVRQISLVGRMPLVSPVESVLEHGNLYLPYYFENVLDFTAAWMRQVSVLLIISIPVYALWFDVAPMVMCIIALLLVVFLLVFMPADNFSRIFRLWGLWVILMTSAYSFVVLGQWFYDRYASSIAVVFNALILIFLSKWLSGKWGWFRLQGVIAVVLIFCFVMLLWGGSYRWLIGGPSAVPDDGFYRTTEYLNRTLGEDNKVGVFQAGLIGYYANSKVFNLDGKLNREARAAIQTSRMFEYICRSGIEYIADWESLIDRMLIRRSVDWKDDNLILQKRIQVPRVTDIVIYRVNQSNCASFFARQ